MSGTHREAETGIWVPLGDMTFNITNKSERKTTLLELQEHLVSLGLTSAAWYGFLFIIHFHGFMYYICADDSNILSSWPEWPTASTVFPLGWLSDTRNSANTKTLSPWSSAHNLTPSVFSVSRNSSVIHTGTHSRSLRFISWQLSFLLLISHQGLQIKSLVSNSSSLPHSLASYYNPVLRQDPPSLSLHVHTHSSDLFAQVSKVICFPKWKNQLTLFSSKWLDEFLITNL